jgi:ATP-binding cassette subfamily B protein
VYKVILKKNIKYLVLGVILSILSSALYVFAGYSLTYLFNSYNQRAQITKIILNGVSVLAVWGVTLLMMYIYSVFQQKIICRMKTDLREMMAQKIISIDYGEFSDKDTGNYVSWMTNDVEQISKDAFSNFFVIIDSIAQTIFSLFALFYLGIGIGVMAIVLFLLMVAIPQLASIGLEKKSELMSKSNEEATEKYKENIGGFIIFYLANRSNYFVDKIKEISYLQEKAIFAKEKKTVFVEIIGASVGLFCQISLIVITIFMASLGLTPIGAVLDNM